MSEKEIQSIPLEREVIKRIEYPRYINSELRDKWDEGIPEYSEADPSRPEWRPTGVIPIDLSGEGYGPIQVKNEADLESNRTGTIKDRAAWELATLYRDYARALWAKMKTGEMTKYDFEGKVIPRFSLITAGNEGRAVAECFKKYDLPPPKLIIDKRIPQPRLEELKKLRADIYMIDLARNPFSGKPSQEDHLTTEQIETLTDNQGGVDITSIKSFEPQAIFYDWHVHEAFNEEPSEIYIPYGSGRLMENYLYWQGRTWHNENAGTRDARLKANALKVISIDILGAEPEDPRSRADKLIAPVKPFLIFQDQDISAFRKLELTGRNTDKYRVGEDYIKQAYEIFKRYGVEAEPSGAAGLALYLQRFEKGLVREGDKILIVNTGKGLYEEELKFE